ncbi:MAG: hypothetical protein JWL83_916 [Actinomycetia bacterium]|nr:hypothetical protein [Actinomycetes bacterium]
MARRDEPHNGGQITRRITPSGRVVLGVATALFFVIALQQAWTDGPTFDEGFTLVGGVTALTRHDLRIVPQHPPLGKLVAAIPVLFLHPRIPSGRIWTAAAHHRADYTFVRVFMNGERTSGHLQRDLFAARAVDVLEAAAVAWVIAMLGSRLFGSFAGVFGGLLWLANPFVIGIGHLDGIDMPATLTVVLLALLTLTARRDPRARFVVLAGVVGGLTILTRTTGLLMVPAAALAVATPLLRTDWRKALLRGATVIVLAWLTVMVAYALMAPGDIVAHSAGVATVLKHLVVPPMWWRGTDFLYHVGNIPAPAFVLGFTNRGRWILYWPASLLVKLPPATLAVMIIGPFFIWKLPRDTRRDAAMVLLLPAALHTVFTVQQQRPIGLRYLLPALALWVAAATPIVAITRNVVRRATAAVVVAGAVAASVVTPAIAWTNPLLGPGYRQAADSNLDWGQAQYALARWSAHHHPWIQYFGGATASDFPGARGDLRAAPPAKTVGWVAVSASSLTTWDRERLAWLRAYCPVGVLERSVLLYRFREPPDRSLVGPSQPPRPCSGSVSVRAG